MGEMNNAYKLVRKPEGKGLIGRPTYRWKGLSIGTSGGLL